MFTGIVTDIGDVVAVRAAGGGAAPHQDRLQLSARLDRRGRLDRLLGRVPHRRRHRRGGRAHLVLGRCRRRDAAADHRRRLAARDQDQSRARAESRRRARRSRRRRACRRARDAREARGSDRDGAHDAARAGRARAFHRAQGIGHARRRVADRQRGRGRHLHGADHPAHPEGDDARRARGRRTRSISKSTSWPATRRG